MDMVVERSGAGGEVDEREQPVLESASSSDRQYAKSGEVDMVVEGSGAEREVDEEREQPVVESASSPDRQ